MKRMLSHHCQLCILVALVSAPFVGCAPVRLADGIVWEIRRSKTTNAAWQFVKDNPGLRFNSYLMDRLQNAASLTDVQEARKELSQTLEAAFTEGRYAFNNEIDRLPHASLRFLWRHYASQQPVPESVREAIRDRFWREVELDYERLQATVSAAPDLHHIRALAHGLISAALPSPKDRRGGGPLLALVAATIEVPPGPLERGGRQVDLYSPQLHSHDTTDSETDLLLRFAPIVVQERWPTARYSVDTDLIGTVELLGVRDRPEVHVNTDRSSVYGYVQYTCINGRRFPQLTYTHWYPRHHTIDSDGRVNCSSCEGGGPSLFDPEAGAVDGAILRITLDSQQRPAIFESVMSCGCYHRCYVADFVETAACDELGGPVDGKSRCVERPMKGRIDWIVPNVIDVDDSSQRPIVFCRAGYHGLADITFDDRALAGLDVLNERPYVLEPYESLERLPLDGGHESMFDAKGLVRGADRIEGVLLALTGMLSAGQPRQRGTQLLHWDQYDFDDPHLLETCLRLPDRF